MRTLCRSLLIASLLAHFSYGLEAGKEVPSLPAQIDGISFTCDRLIWQHAPQILTLQGEVRIEDKDVGKIHCVDEIELHQKEEQGKWILSTIIAKGKTTLNYQLRKGIEHSLICHGNMHLDQLQHILTLDSPEGQPIEYYHDQMKLSANQARLDYAEGTEKNHPSRVELLGSVHLATSDEDTRCALADRFLYYPDEEKMILTSNDGGKVLFWDPNQDLSISAREVHVSRTEKGDNIRGVGDVRFAFSSTENVLLKKVFPFYKPRKGQ